MSTAGGPRLSTDGLVLAIDAANTRGISPAANEEFNNSDQFVKNMVDSSYTITANNGVKIGNLNYYTAFGITYPEGNYGGSAAARDGITPGFNVTSGTKTYDCSRDLNMFVFNDDTNSWVADSYFNGERVSGHCYDTYDGQPSQHATFQSDYDNIKATFPNATFIIIGSHAAENNDNDSGTLSRLQELGFPDSQIGVGRPEYILVGKPGKNYVYVYENYSTNPSQVAHAVFPLPINKVNKDNYFEFDGSNDYIETTLSNPSGDWIHSIIFWMRLNTAQSSIGSRVDPFSIGLASNTRYSAMDISNNNVNWYFYGNDTRTYSNLFSANTWYHIALTYTGGGATTSTKTMYINGSKHTWGSNSGANYGQNLNMPANATLNIGRDGDRNTAYFPGDIAKFKVYSNKALSEAQVLRDYNATKRRFGL